MKRWLFLIALLSCFSSFCQSDSANYIRNNSKIRYKAIWADSSITLGLFRIMATDSISTRAYARHYADSVVAIGGGSSKNADSLQHIIGTAYMKYADSATMLMAYRIAINSRLKYTDTAGMLAAYATAINLRMKYTDTTAMLAAYQTSLNGKQAQLNGTGFVKVSGTTITYDNSSYLTITSAASTYFPLIGGSITGGTGNGFVGFPTQSTDPTTITGQTLLYRPPSGLGFFALRHSNGFISYLNSSITANRTWRFPDSTGTVALTQNIPAVFNQYAQVWVDTLGNDATGQVGNAALPFKTIKAALGATTTPFIGRVVNIGYGTFTSPDTFNIRSNTWFRGSGKPVLNSQIKIPFFDSIAISSPTKLVGGTILDSTLALFGKNNIIVTDLGIDVGADWSNSKNGGIAADGLVSGQYFNLANNPPQVAQSVNPPYYGIVVDHVIVLGKSPTSPFHDFLFENTFNPIISNCEAYNNIYGFVFKTIGGTITNLITAGHDTSPLIFKSNFYAQCTGVTISNVYIYSLTPWDTDAMWLQPADAGFNLSRLKISNINIYKTRRGVLGVAGPANIDECSIDGVNITKTQGDAFTMSNFVNGSMRNITIDSCGGRGFVDTLGSDHLDENIFANKCQTGISISGNNPSGQVIVNNVTAVKNSINNYVFGANTIWRTIVTNGGNTSGTYPYESIPNVTASKIAVGTPTAQASIQSTGTLFITGAANVPSSGTGFYADYTGSVVQLGGNNFGTNTQVPGQIGFTNIKLLTGTSGATPALYAETASGNGRIGINTLTPSAGFDANVYGRFSGAANVPITGAGLEFFYQSDTCYHIAYNRTDNRYINHVFNGLNYFFRTRGNRTPFLIDSTTKTTITAQLFVNKDSTINVSTLGTNMLVLQDSANNRIGRSAPSVLYPNLDTRYLQSSNSAFDSTAKATVSTTNATPTTIMTIPIQTGSVYFVQFSTDGNSGSGSAACAFQQVVLIRNPSGTAVIADGGTQNIFTPMQDSSLGTTSVTASVSGTNLIIQVTGVASTNINWKTSITIRKV